MYQIWIKDPKTRKPSATLTILVLTVFVCLGKLALSGMSYKKVKFEKFTGGDFATAVGAVGIIYAGRKWTDSEEPVESGKKEVL